MRPLQCVLFRGRNHTIVRRWAPDTRLNGGNFTDAKLRPGDRLSIGPIDLEVLELGAPPLQRATPETPRRVELDRQMLAAEEARLQQRRESLDAREEAFKQQLANGNAQRDAAASRAAAQSEEVARKQAELAVLRERFQAEQAEWRSRQEHAERTLAEREAAARRTAGQAEDLSQARAELEALRERFQAEQAEWRARQEHAERMLGEREAAARQAAGQVEDLSQARAELEALRERFQAEQAEWRTRQEHAERMLGERTEELDRRESALQASEKRSQGVSGDLRLARDELDNNTETLRRAQETLDQERQAFAREMEEVRAQLGQERECLEQERKRVQQERVILEDELCRLESERAKLPASPGATASLSAERTEAPGEELGDGRPEASAEVVPVEEAAEESPVDLAEVLRRLGKVEILSTDDDDQEAVSVPESDDSLRPTAGEEGSSARANADGSPDTSTEHEGDVSVDEYMSQLMRRVRGTSTSESASQPNRPMGRKAEPRSAPPDPSAPPVDPAPRKPVKLKPRGPAPERQGFAAMRELANVSARSAVDQHARRQMISIRRSKLAVAITAGLAGCVLFWLWTTYAPIGVTVLAAGTSFTVALLWALQYAIVTGRLLIGPSGLLSFRRSGKTATQTAEVLDATDPAETP